MTPSNSYVFDMLVSKRCSNFREKNEPNCISAGKQIR